MRIISLEFDPLYLSEQMLPCTGSVITVWAFNALCFFVGTF